MTEPRLFGLRANVAHNAGEDQSRSSPAFSRPDHRPRPGEAGLQRYPASPTYGAEYTLGEELVGVVLAAGAGTRLAPLTELRPKALCPVDNRPLLDWAMDRLAPHCSEVAVNIHAHREQMLRHLSGTSAHLSVESPVALGTAGALGQLRDWIAGRPVLLTNADAWQPASKDYLSLLRKDWTGRNPRLLCVETAASSDFGHLRYVASALLPWWSVAELQPQPSGLYEVSWHRLQAEGRLELFVLPGEPPIDCGTPQTYLQANLTASGGHSVIGSGAVVEGEVVRTVVWPNSYVGPHERLVDSIRAGDLTVHAGE